MHTVDNDTETKHSLCYVGDSLLTPDPQLVPLHNPKYFPRWGCSGKLPHHGMYVLSSLHIEG